MMTGLMDSVLTLGAGNPVEHVINHLFPGAQTESGWWLWSSNQTNLVLSGIICLAVGAWAAREIRTGAEAEGHDRYITKNPFAGMIEVISLYLRDEICKPLLHGRTDRFMPFLWTALLLHPRQQRAGAYPSARCLARDHGRADAHRPDRRHRDAEPLRHRRPRNGCLLRD